MKTNYLLLGIATLVAACGLWAGRVAWRVHRQLVSLDVRNMALAEVLHKIEWQTWKKIRAERALDARITLHVTDKPLKDALDRIAEQAGARWSTVYAVYQSTTGRQALEKALAGDGKLEAAGWSKVAPKSSEFDQAGAGGAGPVFHSSANSDPPGPITGPEPQGMGDGPSPGGPGPMTGQGRMTMFRRGPSGAVMFSGNANGQTEMWSPEELVMETPLSARLGTEANPAPTAQEAQETARKLNGQWTTYLAFKRSIMGVGFAGLGRPGAGPLKRGPNVRFAELTPQQRVQQARERRGFEAGAGMPGR